jgi:hypothetical protein
MDLEIIEILYKFGKIFALTPPSSKRKKLNHLQKYYSFLIFALYLVGVTIHNYNVISYHTVLSPTRLTLTIYYIHLQLYGPILHFDNCHGPASKALVHIDPESQKRQNTPKPQYSLLHNAQLITFDVFINGVP